MCMAFAQLTYRESLRDIECCLRAMNEKLYHMGIKGNVSRSTLADANEKRDWRIYSEFAIHLINQARQFYANEDFGLELKDTVYALDASTIDLCLSVFPWARFRTTKAGVKLHALLDLRGSIPSFIDITDAKVHDVNNLDKLIPEPDSIYVMDRANLDFERLYRMHQCSTYFVIRKKTNTNFKRLYSNKIDKSTVLKCDQIIVLSGYYSRKSFPDKLRRVKYYDLETEKLLNFFTNQFTFSALTISELYRCRWRVEIFFKWIKQHLRIKSFYGTSENAVKTQIWIAISVYVLVAIMKKRMQIELSLYTILQILSITLFEKKQILQVLTETDYKNQITRNDMQLKLFDF